MAASAIATPPGNAFETQPEGNAEPFLGAQAIDLNSAPSLNLNQMIEALGEQQGGAPSADAQAPSPPRPAAPATPELPATLSAPTAPTPSAPAAPTLPTELGDFTPTEPQQTEATDEGTDVITDDRQRIGPGIVVGPDGLPNPEQLLGLAGEEQLMGDLELLSQLFGEHTGFSTSSPTLIAQSLAITFVDYLYRSDRVRLRALVGAPFYADEFPLENLDELNRIFGEPAPITTPPKEIIPERANDKLVGITTMRISELRHSEFYRGDRGADLIGLQEDDFFIYIVFERGELMAPMVVYIRRKGEGYEVAGFYD